MSAPDNRLRRAIEFRDLLTRIEPAGDVHLSKMFIKMVRQASMRPKSEGGLDLPMALVCTVTGYRVKGDPESDLESVRHELW